MKRSKFDRFIADPSGHEQDVSAEAYVTVTDEGRRAVLISWRYLAVGNRAVRHSRGGLGYEPQDGRAAGPLVISTTDVGPTGSSVDPGPTSGFHVSLVVC
jgi:hypothetical protein